MAFACFFFLLHRKSIHQAKTETFNFPCMDLSSWIPSLWEEKWLHGKFSKHLFYLIIILDTNVNVFKTPTTSYLRIYEQGG